MTTIKAFRDSLSQTAPAAELSPALQALWWARKGEWDRAHVTVQQHEGTQDCDLVHAHLHRQEGDLANAASWYRRAGSSMTDMPLDEEQDAIARSLMAR